MQKPNLIYIGTSKAGSTWIYNLLNQHPHIFMAPGKGAYYFDSHFENGEEWYLDHFRHAGNAQVRGEVSHSYLFSRQACERIYAFNPNVKLMACLRNPVDRAFSSYLDRVKNGRFSGTFEQALEADEMLIDRGKYATHLKCYLDQFGRNGIHIARFDDIKNQPELFARELFEFLCVDQPDRIKMDLRKRMPAGKPRSTMITASAKRIAKGAKMLGLRRLIGTAKTSVLLRNVLYRPYSDQDKPQMNVATREHLKTVFRGEIQQLDQMLGSNFEEQWLGKTNLVSS